jgi:acyl-CoA synthetase (AMP-forming)/AMP-acid ligase II
MRLDAPDSRDAPLQGIVMGALEADGARFGHAVGDRHLAHVHLVDDLAQTLEAVQAERCTGLHGVPTMFIAMLEHPEFARFDASGSNPSDGLTMHEPWVTQARLPSTMPKQW